MLYMTRNKALKKLQISLADFRRLCILKGIFPREPANKRKLQNGSSAPTTYYFAKDIRFLAHEPVLARVREHKTFLKRVAKALGKGEGERVERLVKGRPQYRLDHIIRERYPTFGDALRDVDDALSLVYLFASLPAMGSVTRDTIDACRRLAREFELAVAASGSLRRTFLSIKGIYYQAEIHGETVTWLTPYEFTTAVPRDVDFRVMATFLEFYVALMGFVNYRLYREAGLKYPPGVDEGREAEGAGVDALVAERVAVAAVGERAQAAMDRATVESLKATLPPCDDESEDDSEEGDCESEDKDMSATKDTENSKDDVFVAGREEALASVRRLFHGAVFLLGRETPRTSLHFVIRSFGGRIAEDAADRSITHCIVDRGSRGDGNGNGNGNGNSNGNISDLLERVSVQPQWVYDCVNAGRLLAAGPYAPGTRPPAHVSPFESTEATPEHYVPSEAAILRGAGDGADGEEKVDGDGSGSGSGSGSDASEGESEGEEYQRDIEREVSGIEREVSGIEREVSGIEREVSGTPTDPTPDTKTKTKKPNKKTPSPPTPTPTPTDTAHMAKSLMSRRDRKLYDALQHRKRRGEAAVAVLAAKKQRLNGNK